MLEGLVADKLTSILSEYLEGVSRDDLKLSAGDITLKSIRLKRSALDSLDLPIAVVRGQLGLLQITIPWTSLKSSPVIVKISDVYLVVKPKKQCEWDEKYEKEKLWKQKQNQIWRYEQIKAQKKQQQQQQDAQSGEKSKSWLSWLTDSSITQTVLSNLQIMIENVHVRYEDTSEGVLPVVFGATLKELTLRSSDENFLPVFVKDAVQSSMMFKIAELKQLSIYSNTSVATSPLPQQQKNSGILLGDPSLSMDQFLDGMRALAQGDQSKSISQSVQYLLRPINGALRVSMQRHGSLNLAVPRIKAQLLFDDFSIDIDDIQYRGLLTTLQYMTAFRQADKLRVYRPLERPLESHQARLQWWRYACMTLKDQVRREYFAWGDIVDRKKKRDEYISLHKRKNEVPWLTKLDDSGKSRLEQLEMELEVEDIVFYRELAGKELEAEGKNYEDYLRKKKEQDAARAKEQPQKSGWFSGWFGGGAQSDSSTVSELSNLITLTDDDKEKLYKSIGADASEEAVALSVPDEFVEVQLGFQLRQGGLRLVDSAQRNTIVRSAYTELGLSIQLLADASFQAELKLQTFAIYDEYTKATKFREILSHRSTQIHEYKEQKPLLFASVATGKKLKETGYDLGVKIELDELDLIVNPVLIQRIVAFFVIPSDVDISEVQSSAMSGVTSAAQRAQTQLMLVMDSKKAIDLSVLIDAPNIILIENVDAQEDTSMLVVDLGVLKMVSNNNPLERKRKLQQQEDLDEEDYYDNFDVGLTQVQVFLSKYGSWSTESTSGMEQVLDRLDLDLHVAVCVIAASQQPLPRFKIKGALPSIDIILSPSRLEKGVNIFNSLVFLLDDPTGSIAQQKKRMSEKLSVIGPAQFSTGEQFWCELSQSGKIHIKTNETDKRSIATIGLREAKLLHRIEPNHLGLESIDQMPKFNNPFGVLLTQEDGKIIVFAFDCPSRNSRSAWMTAVKNMILDISKNVLQEKLSSAKNDVSARMMEQIVFADEIDEEEESTDSRNGQSTADATQKGITASSPESTSLVLDFALDKFRVCLHNDEKDVAEFAFASFNVNFRMRQHDMQASVSVRALAIRDAQTHNYAVRTSMTSDSSNLASIHFVQASQGSPIFDPEAAMSIAVVLGTVHVTFDPVFLNQVILFVYGVQNMLANVAARTQQYVAVVTEATKEDRHHEVIRNSSIKFSMSGAELMLVLFDDGRKFISLTMSDSSVELFNSPLEFKIGAKVRDLVVQDHSEKALYKEILGMKEKGESLVEFSYRSLKVPPQNAASEPYFSQFISAKMSAVRFVYCHRVIKDLQLYFTDGVLWRTLATGGSAKVAKAGYDLIREQQRKAKSLGTHARTSMQFEFIQPTLTVPVAYSSSDRLMGDLVSIRIHKNLRVVGSSWVEELEIHLDKMNVRTRMNGKLQRALDSVDMRLVLGWRISGPSVPDFRLALHVSPVQFCMSHAQYQLIFRMVDGNFGDTGKAALKKPAETAESKDHESAKLSERLSQLQSGAKAINNMISGDSQSSPQKNAQHKSAVSAEDERVNPITSEYTFTFEDMSVQLQRGTGELYGKQNNLARLSMKGFNVLYQYMRNGDSNLEIKMHALAAEDLRAESESLFRSIVSRDARSGLNSDIEHFLIFTLSYVHGNTHMKCYMADPRIIFVPEAIREIISFFQQRRPEQPAGPQDKQVQAVAAPITAPQDIESSQPVDVQLVQPSETLGEDLYLDGKLRRIVVQHNDAGEVILDGRSNAVRFADVSGDSQIIITEGMKLKLRNIRLVYQGQLLDCVQFGRGSSFEFEGPDVIHESVQLNPTETNATAQSSSQSDQTRTAIVFEGQFGRPCLVFPEDATQSDTRFFVIQTTLRAQYSRTARGSESGAFIVDSLEAFAEDGRSRGASIVDAVGFHAQLTCPDVFCKDVIARTVELHITSKNSTKVMGQLRIRLSYNDFKMVSNIVAKLQKQSQTDLEETLKQRLLTHGTDYVYDSLSEYEPTSHEASPITPIFEDSDDEGDVIYQDTDDESDAFQSASEGSPDNDDEDDLFMDAEEEREFDEEIAQAIEQTVIQSVEEDEETTRSDVTSTTTVEQSASDASLSKTKKRQSKALQAISKARESKKVGDASDSTSNIFHLIFKADRAISVLIVDDLKGYDVPLLDLNVSKLQLDDTLFDVATKKALAHLTFQVDLSYYNIDLASWEPIIEAWSCEVAFNRLPRPMDPDGNFQYYASLASETTLNINVSRTMLRGITVTSMLWKEDFKRDIKSVSTQFEPFLIRNHSGRSLNYWKEKDSDKKLKLADGEERGIDFAEQYSRTQQLTVLGVVAEIEGFAPVAFDARKVGKHTAEDNSKESIIMIAVEQSEGRMVITVRSGFVLLNSTTMPIEVALISKMYNDKVDTIGVIQPGASRGLPLITSVANTYLCVRPHLQSASGQAAFEWSKPYDPISFLNIMKHQNVRLFECKGADVEAKQRTHYFVGLISAANRIDPKLKVFLKRQHKIARLQKLDFCINIVPPLCINNVLQSPMVFSMFERYSLDNTSSKDSKSDGKRLVFPETVLKRGKKQFIYTANLQANVLMRCCLAHHGWKSSRLAVLTSNERPAKPPTLMLPIADDREQTLLLHFEYEYTDSRAFRLVNIFVPYWIMNHTGLPLQIFDGNRHAAGNHMSMTMNPRVSQDSLSLQDATSEPMPFSFLSEGESKIKLMTGEHSSQPASIDVIGVPQAVDLSPNLRRNSSEVSGLKDSRGAYRSSSAIQMTMTVSIGPGKYSRTKIVAFHARYICINQVEGKSIEIRQVGGRKSVSIQSRQRQNMFLSKVQEMQLLQVREASDQCFWSQPFNAQIVGDVPLKITRQDGSQLLLNVNIQEESGISFVLVESLHNPPYRISNKTNRIVHFCQTGLNTWYELRPKDSCDFFWDDRTKPQTLQLKVGTEVIMDDLNINAIRPRAKLLEFSKPSSLLPFQLLQRKVERTTVQEKLLNVLYGSVESRGPTRVFRLTEHGLDQEEKVRVEFEELSLTVNIPSIGISLIDTSNFTEPEELLYVTVQGLNVDIRQTTQNRLVRAHIQLLQIDNQILDAMFPVLLAPTSVPTRQSQQRAADQQLVARPMIEFAMTQNTKAKGMQLFPYLSVLVQEFDVAITTDVVLRLIRFFSHLTATGANAIADSADDEDDRSTEQYLHRATEPVTQANRQQKIYFQDFTLHPIHLHLTLKMTDLGDEVKRNPLFRALSKLGITILNVDDASMRFYAIKLEDTIVTQPELMSRIQQHYRSEAIMQLAKLLLSFEAIGNPAGLVMNIGEGVKDLFYEPYDALVHDPLHFVHATVKGTRSFATKVAQSTSNSAAKLSGTVGKALGMLTFDSDYQRERDQKSKRKAMSVGEGLADGTMSLAKGMVDGATGVFLKPIQGVKKEGILGLAKGIGQGLIGAPLKTVTGAIDLVQKTAEGISNTGKVARKRMRIPRSFRADGALTQYNALHAFVNAALKIQADPREQALLYCQNKNQGSESEVFVLGKQAVYGICIRQKQITWQAPFNKIQQLMLINVSGHQQNQGAGASSGNSPVTRKGSKTPQDLSKQLNTPAPQALSIAYEKPQTSQSPVFFFQQQQLGTEQRRLFNQREQDLVLEFFDKLKLILAQTKDNTIDSLARSLL